MCSILKRQKKPQLLSAFIFFLACPLILPAGNHFTNFANLLTTQANNLFFICLMTKENNVSRSCAVHYSNISTV